jgi:hypothetical protein
MMRTIEATVERLANGTKMKGIVLGDSRVSAKEMAAFAAQA